MIVKAPGVVKLLGEHAAVYGRLSVAVGIEKYAKASLSRTRQKALIIDAPDFGASETISEQRLHKVYTSYQSRKSIDEFIAQNQENRDMLPFVAIAARLMNEFGINPIGIKVRLTSDIPIQKGLASSAALSAAMAVALIKNSGKSVPDNIIIDVIRDGERIIHRNENAGRIDASTAYLGGYTSFSSVHGARKFYSSTIIDLLIVDTGPKKSTAQTVGHVAELYKSDKEGIGAIFDMIGKCSEEGIGAIKEGKVRDLGALMYKDHELLQSLGVSSAGLDRVVEIAKANGAYGAKLSGGGGGGIAIVLPGRNRKMLEERFKESGFQVMEAKASYHGASYFLWA